MIHIKSVDGGNDGQSESSGESGGATETEERDGEMRHGWKMVQTRMESNQLHEGFPIVEQDEKTAVPEPLPVAVRQYEQSVFAGDERKAEGIATRQIDMVHEHGI